MSADDATGKVREHEAKVEAGGAELQAQSEQKLGEMSGASDRGKSAQENAESKPKSALDDQPDDSDPA